MPEQPQSETFHLDNAPIVEALIEIKLAQPLLQDSLGALKECAESLKPHYPVQQDIVAQEGQLHFGDAPSSSVTSQKLGFFCKDSDGPAAHRVVHLKLDAFGLSELKPYTSWNGFFGEAQKLWQDYRQAVGGASLGSWSIRYINQISWPIDSKIEDYLKVHPARPKGLPQALMNCFMRLQSSINDPSEGLFTQQVFQVPTSELGMVSFIVDHVFSFSAIGVEESILWERIERAREVKNEFFRATLTDKALEMYR